MMNALRPCKGGYLFTSRCGVDIQDYLNFSFDCVEVEACVFVPFTLLIKWNKDNNCHSLCPVKNNYLSDHLKGGEIGEHAARE